MIVSIYVTVGEVLIAPRNSSGYSIETGLEATKSLRYTVLKLYFRTDQVDSPREGQNKKWARGPLFLYPRSGAGLVR